MNVFKTIPVRVSPRTPLPGGQSQARDVAPEFLVLIIGKRSLSREGRPGHASDESMLFIDDVVKEGRMMFGIFHGGPLTDRSCGQKVEGECILS
jgi:hypothetical protein